MAYLDTIKPGALRGWREEQVLASVIGAQAALESGWGTSSLSKPPHNNQFGIKASSEWTGRIINMPTREWGSGGWYVANEDFRSYDSVADSLLDHAKFFTNTAWRKENYKNVVGETDYKKACWALQNAPAPYATDPGYAQKLIDIIEQNNLQAWDREATSDQSTETVATTPTQVNRTKMVGADLTAAAREYVVNLPVTVIGDSLGVGTRPHLQSIITTANFDVLGSRQITHATPSLNGTKVLTDMKNAGTLKEYVVVILGTNRGVTEQEVNNFVSIAGSERKVIFVDTASQVAHADQVSIYYTDAAKRLSNVFYVNWKLKASSHMAEYYSKDGANGEYIHMTSAGYKKHAEFIAQALYEVATGDFTERTAVTPEIDYYNIKTLELKTDGTITYDAWKINSDGTSTKYKATKQTDIKGLSSPYGDDSIYNGEANQQWGFGGSINNSNWLESRYTDNDETDMLKLVEMASIELLDRATPDIQYTVSLMDMPDTISIGDTGVFVDHDFNPPLYIQARIISITTSQTNPMLNKVVIGNVIELQPQSKNEILAMQEELRRTREELKDEWINAEPVSASITTTNGYVLGDKFNETDLVAKVVKAGVNVTDQYTSFKWERNSPDSASDTVYNQVLQETTQSSVLSVTAKDIIGNQSKFTARVYNAKDEMVHQTEITIKRVETALWTDTDTPPPDAQEGSKWVDSDGNQMIKVDGEWEDVVDQKKATEIVRRDGVTVSFSDQPPSNGGKSGDVWFKLNPDGTESIMRHDGTDWFETVTNAMNADGIIEGTMDFSIVNAININASSISAGHGDFLTLALHALNSKLSMDGAAVRIVNDDGSYIELNNVPEIRSTAADGTSVILDGGRAHFFDSLGQSKGSFGTDRHDGTRDLGIWLSKGSGTFRIAKMATANAVEAKYYVVEPGDARVSIVTKLVQRGELPDGDSADFIRKSNMIAGLNGWPKLPQEWPTLSAGQQIKYQEEIVGTSGDAYDNIIKVGPSSQGDERVYFEKYATFEAGTNISSDRRIKENIKPTDVVALDDIDEFDFVQFDMTKTGTHTEIGMIAQEAGRLRVIDETEGIDLQGSIMLALKGVQELHAKLKQQEIEINELKEQLKG